MALYFVLLYLFFFLLKFLFSYQIVYRTYIICYPTTYAVYYEDEYGNSGEREETEYNCTDFVFRVYLLEPGDLLEWGETGGDTGGGGGSGSSSGQTEVPDRDTDNNGIIDCWSYSIISSNLFISSYFGETRGDKVHNGIDITGPDVDGKPIVSAVNGYVVEIGENEFNGIYIKLKSIMVFTGHNLHISVSTEIRNGYVNPLDILGDC
ncbi:MAG: hypothetical protein QME28_09795 [Candidatus Saccharicenans sp.]|nr:hypothetical protein [Candidatus Saccharicenans sp.]